MGENTPPADDAAGGPLPGDRTPFPDGHPTTGHDGGPSSGWSSTEPAASRGPHFEHQPTGYAPQQPGYPQHPGGWAPPTSSPFGGPAAPAPANAAPGPWAATALPPRPRTGPRAGAVVAVSALTAVVIGGVAGYGGSVLASRSDATSPAVSATSGPTAPDPGTSGSASPLPPPPAQADTVEIARRVLPGTVMIQIGSSTGSGFVLDTQGRIMTNNHVVAGAADGGRIRVVFADGRRQNATLLGRSPSYDLAVIKVRASQDLRPLPVGNSDESEVGQPVVAVGAPLGLPGTVTQGIVSARDRPVVVNADSDADAPTAYINAIQTDAPINPGNSGGPLIDAAGRVIGVNSAILTLGASQGQTGNIGLGFAIPVNQANQIGRQLISRGKATYPVIGATVTDGAGGGGVEISTVEGRGPAAAAGLRPGDVVDRIDGRTVRTMQELIVAIRTRRPGDRVVLRYTRGSADRSATVTLGSKEG